MRKLESPRANKRLTFSPELRDFLRRRTLPFLDANGLSRPISFVLEEVYLQGMKDAVQAMEEGHEPTGSLPGNVSDNDAERDAPSGIAC